MAETTSSYDVVVIGGGPGGYVHAIRAAQLGFKVACVEKRAALGGTCLNVGCIPSKALLHTSHLYEESKLHFAPLGIDVSGVKLNLKQMLAKKDEIVGTLTKGIEGLFKKNKIDWINGLGSIPSAGKVLVDFGKKKETIAAKHIVIATGSEVAQVPGVTIDEKTIVSSTGALSLGAVPKQMIVIGGGYIGLEMGSVWRRLGAQVTVVEYADTILPAMDADVVKQFHRILEKQGLVFKLGTKVAGAKTGKAGVVLTVEPAKGGKPEELKADVVLVSVGRRPFTDGLGLAALGVQQNERGYIKVDDHFQTSVKGIYAIGDVIPGPMLAHKAEHDGVALAEILAGQVGHVNYDLVPAVVYTNPEIATVGKTEEQLKKDGVAYNVGKFPFMANSRARTVSQTDGFVKILADSKTDRILGAHIIGPEAGTLIHEVVAVMEFGGAAEDIARICHAHPTLNEAVKEAALAVDKRTINL